MKGASLLAAVCGMSFAQVEEPRRELSVSAGKSLLIDSSTNMQRIPVANGELAEAVASSPREVLVNGKMSGETSLIIWQQNGSRLFYDVTVRYNPAGLEAAREEIRRELPKQDVSLTFEDDTVFLEQLTERKAAPPERPAPPLVQFVPVPAPAGPAGS